MILTGYGVYLTEKILILRQADKFLPKLGSSLNYSTENRNKLAGLKIN